MKKAIVVTMALIMTALFMVSCAPKVMVQTRYTNNEKTAKLLTRKDGETFSRYLQVCDVNGNGTESNCKETMILDRINNAVAFR